MPVIKPTAPFPHPNNTLQNTCTARKCWPGMYQGPRWFHPDTADRPHISAAEHGCYRARNPRRPKHERYSDWRPCAYCNLPLNTIQQRCPLSRYTEKYNPCLANIHNESHYCHCSHPRTQTGKAAPRQGRTNVRIQQYTPCRWPSKVCWRPLRSPPRNAHSNPNERHNAVREIHRKAGCN